MPNCSRFPSPFMALLIAFALLCSSSQSTVQAQPLQEKQVDIEQLQSQLAAIQAQISAIKPALNEQDNDRVRSVGSQRTKRLVEPAIDDALDIRLYDLSDLFAVSPHYPAEMPNDLASSNAMFRNRRGEMASGVGQGGFGGGGQGGGGYSGGSGGVFSIAPGPHPTPPRQEAASISMSASQVSMKQLVTTIQQTVEPELWGESREQAKIQFLGNTLLITANESMHKQINNLLNLFREHWGKRRTISIQTFLIRANAAQASELLDEESNEIGAGVVSTKKWEAFLESAKTEKRFAYSSTMTGHNNQTLHTLSGQQRQLTIDAVPFKSNEAQMWFEKTKNALPFRAGNVDNRDEANMVSQSRQIVGFKPVRISFHNGAAIQATPLATRGGNFVIVDLHAKVNELIEPDPEAKKPSIFVQLNNGETAEVQLDHADFVSYRLNTTLRCPKNQVVLAGGMTFNPIADEELPNLYLFVKTSVHTITEDKSDWTNDSPQTNE
ncbi:MAG: hypothetical protein ACI814_000536 [Mariniblastus sp.]|jgi:hypothetical protein